MKTKLKSIILGTIFSLIHFKSFALGKVEISGYVKLDQVYNPADNLKETSKQTFSDGALLRDAAINFYSPLSENISFNLEFNIAKPVGEGILQGVNMLDSSYHVGVNTVGQSLRNANQQLRSEPPNPQVNVSPWMNTTIGPDLPRRPLEVGENCATA